ncbi:MAG: hypothetical protein QHJ81_14720 [Anaerolineae bacterium]|nr:hypothetical protein [Anaerolineae bacterium]
MSCADRSLLLLILMVVESVAAALCIAVLQGRLAQERKRIDDVLFGMRHGRSERPVVLPPSTSWPQLTQLSYPDYPLPPALREVERRFRVVGTDTAEEGF